MCCLDSLTCIQSPSLSVHGLAWAQDLAAVPQILSQCSLWSRLPHCLPATGEITLKFRRIYCILYNNRPALSMLLKITQHNLKGYTWDEKATNLLEGLNLPLIKFHSPVFQPARENLICLISDLKVKCFKKKRKKIKLCYLIILGNMEIHLPATPVGCTSAVISTINRTAVLCTVEL